MQLNKHAIYSHNPNFQYLRIFFSCVISWAATRISLSQGKEHAGWKACTGTDQMMQDCMTLRIPSGVAGKIQSHREVQDLHPHPHPGHCINMYKQECIRTSLWIFETCAYSIKQGIKMERYLSVNLCTSSPTKYLVVLQMLIQELKKSSNFYLPF